ncbi:MAG: SDR family oxidoreductase [Burkholderiales bacterium]|nr:SDR family oxidoreductase [Anaerolineae bacterium]
MKLAVFGASGRTGQHIVRQALEAGHEVAALVRNPSKLNFSHERLHITQGNVQNVANVETVIAGVDAVLSTLGPTNNTADHQVTKGTQNILVAMKKHGVRRLVISAGAGVGDPNDKPTLIHKFFGLLVKVLSRNAYEDMMQVVGVVRQSDVDWVIVRVPRLTDAPATGSLKVGYVGKDIGTQLSRADMAMFMLQQLESNTNLRQAPAISN